MKDILEKAETLRTARAQAVIEAPAAVIERLRARTLDKGDALEVARAAGIMAAKRTSDLIPLCHPLPLRRLTITYDFGDDRVKILADAGVIAPTGVEMEALTAVTICALTLYDMLKPLAGLELTITDIRLLEKTGGKSGLTRAQNA